MGVRGQFGHLFGPDLVNAFKSGSVYYERAFALAGLPPHGCLVVDDSPDALGWAAEAGARTVLMNRNGAPATGFPGPIVSDLSSLVALIETMGRRTRSLPRVPGR
jgi:FMN phosphatase YigB (HAD superfamily)